MNISDTPSPLSGQCLLVVDDEPLIAMMLEDLCIEAGASVVCASQLSDGVKAAGREELTAAILDVRIGADTSEEIADRLARRGIPFMFFNGQSLPPNLKAKHPNVPMLIKPALSEDILGVLHELVAAEGHKSRGAHRRHRRS